MSRCSAEGFQSWMSGALIRRLDDFSADEVSLDGSIRIAGFDGRWNLTALECMSVCGIDELRRSSQRLFAVDQRQSELHFAVRQIASYETGIQGKAFCFGANAKLFLKASDMYSLRPLLEVADERGSLSMSEAYCHIQPEIETVWRNLTGEAMRNADWHRENCFTKLRAMENVLGRETIRRFGNVGLRSSGGLRIEGISTPLFICE